MTEETLDIAQHTADTLVEFGVDGIIDDLIGFCLEHLINHLPAGDVLGYHVHALVDETVNGSVNCGVHSEVADVLEDIWILVLVHTSSAPSVRFYLTFSF